MAQHCRAEREQEGRERPGVRADPLGPVAGCRRGGRPGARVRGAEAGQLGPLAAAQCLRYGHRRDGPAVPVVEQELLRAAHAGGRGARRRRAGVGGGESAVGVRLGTAAGHRGARGGESGRGGRSRGVSCQGRWSGGRYRLGAKHWSLVPSDRRHERRRRTRRDQASKVAAGADLDSEAAAASQRHHVFGLAAPVERHRDAPLGKLRRRPSPSVQGRLLGGELVGSWSG
mmetsp:Transcript_3476/g.13777  ORF Transcript_3476/g.13777 Transcript_3476/m.13777 type:complete len:229 (+) Transcript_3476:423-1109(+)